jgi:hypothetical protein
MTKFNPSRRSLVTATAALPALAIPVVALGSADLDPIFAAIAAHREAFMHKMRACRVTVHAEDDTPEQEAAWEAEDAGRDILDQAKTDLGTTQPSTMAGVIALLTYMDDFHVQAFELPEDPTQWHSEQQELGTLVDESILDKFNGRPIELSLNFWVMRNVRAALQMLAKQS